MLDSLWLVHGEGNAFGERFEGLPNVRIVRGRFEDLEPHDAFVTAGNAYGMMTAGIDAAVVGRFGGTLMRPGPGRLSWKSIWGSSRSGRRLLSKPVTRPFRSLCTLRRCGYRGASAEPTRCMWRRGRRYLRCGGIMSQGEGRFARSRCRRWGRGLGACPSAKRPGRWRRLTDMGWSRRRSWIGIWWRIRKREDFYHGMAGGAIDQWG